MKRLDLRDRTRRKRRLAVLRDERRERLARGSHRGVPSGEGYGISESEPVATFDEAVRLLDKHPWYEMRPDVVHPDFRASVWTAVLERRMAPKRERIRWQSAFSDDWRRVCAAQAPKENGHPRND